MSKIVDVRASPQSWPFSGDFGHFGPDAKAGRDHAAVRIVIGKGASAGATRIATKAEPQRLK
jgi:hypothetical protein